ncbi:acyltransferase [Sphingomonas montanisoli]|uniref:acyltransferase n=1 Tax=Sphingomonas montanisoli TaxID=2606412 RepID=UPI0015E1864D|nr:acyltransferase [Sphingomonas montanisoli]
MGNGIKGTLRKLQRSYLIPKSLRTRLLRLAGVDIRDAIVSPGLHLGPDVRVRIEPKAYINAGCFFDDAGDIHIGEYVHLGPGVTLLTTDHKIGAAKKRAGTPFSGTIRIEKGSWLGARAVVFSGVTIAEGCIVGAGAIVTKSTEPHGLYVGAPARRIRDLPA